MGDFVVGIDGSDESVGALRWALAAAGTAHRVRAVTVWTYPVAVGGGMGYGAGMAPVIATDDIEAAAQATLDAVIAEVDAGAADLTADVVMAGSSSGGLVRAADDADLLVVGLRRHSTADRFFMGSVAIQCAHHAPCPFVAVPASSAAIGDVIAVAVDGSDVSAAALRWAAGQAVERDARLRVISVWERINWSTGPRIVDPDLSDDDRALDQLRASVEASAPDAVDRTEYRSVHADRHVADHILDAAEGASLLAVGSRGRGGFTGLLLGSVSQRCLEAAEIPVAIVRE